ncbi:MAG: BatD family protein [Candidatus Edwardsbacteria bacterium]|nr:BatD family protein [Candidatus Edwardsbacteria bacterium]
MLKAKLKYFFSILSAVIITSSVHAAVIDFNASVDQTTVGLGDQFTLTVTVQGQDMASVPKPELPELPDFNLLGNSSSQSTNIQFVNGKMSKQASVNFIYYLSAKKLGQLTIGPCKIKYQEQEYTSQPIQIEVTKSSTVRAQSSRPGRNSGGQANIPLEGNLFLSANSDKRTVYVGEQITVDFTLYNRFQISDAGISEMPTFSGFWTEKVYDADKFSWKQKDLNGKQYNYMMLKRVALFPMSSGELTVSPMSMNIAVVQSSRDFFDFFGTTRSVRVESKPITINAKPLPEGKPAEFTGGVGKFSIQASLDKNLVTGNEPINLTVKITGTGNIRLIEKPLIASIPGLKIMDPEVKENIQVSGDAIKGSKTFTFPIIPQSDGKYVIPAVKLAYFDPADRSYHTIQTQQFECAASGCTQNIPLVEATGMKVLGTDINYLKPDASALKSVSFEIPKWSWLLYLFFPATVLSAFWYRGHLDRLSTDRGYARKHRSSGLVKKRLQLSEKYLKADDLINFYSSLSQAVFGFIGDRYNMDMGARTKEQIHEGLSRHGVPDDILTDILALMDACDRVRFSPSSASEMDPPGMLDKAKEVLSKL